MAILVANLSSSSFCFFSSHHRFQTQKEILVSDVRVRKNVIFNRASLRTDSISTFDRSATDANTRLRRFCESGNLESAVKLLRVSGKWDIDPRTLCSVLQLCSDSRCLNYGKEVDSFIRGNGFVIDSSLGSKLALMYTNCGDLKEASRVFDQVKIEKALFWNILMNELAKSGDFSGSIGLFKKMMSSGVEMDSYTFSCISKSFSSLRSVNGGEQLLGYILKSGFGDRNSVGNSLVAFYLKNQRVDSARMVFDEMTERDVISWNSIINGYVSNGLAEQGLSVFVKMLVSGVEIDLATIVSVFAGCADSSLISLGRAVHSFGLKACFSREDRFCNTLLDMYSKCGDLDSAKAVFTEMSDRSVVSYTSMIAGYAREGLAGEAVKLFEQMEEEGISPDVYTITAVLNCCSRNRLLDEGKRVHEWIKENDMGFDIFVSNALMDMYSKCGSMREAELVFSEMRVKDIISWNTVIGGYSKNCYANEALSLFNLLLEEKRFSPDERTVACVLPACASLSAFDKGREIHGYIMRNGYFSDRHVANSLVDMYAKCGALLLARMLFDDIASKDLVSWTVMIAGYGMHGFGKEAIALFNQMRQAGIEPDEISFVSLLYACSHSGLVDEGWRFFNIMRHECKIEPTVEHYACIVDMLARTGNLSKAYRFIENMPIPPDATIWGALLCGCRIHHDVKLAERVSEKVFELEPENTGYYVLMASIYAEAEKWEEVKRLRRRIGQRGLRKNPGCKTILCMFPRMTKRPEVETGTEETVRSVRLTRRARKTPERPLRRRRKDETAVKECSEPGRRGGGERDGQLRKERDVRDGERALRAVVEIERSAEQFVKEIEVTRRNGELASQITTEVGLVVGWWLQGSLAVGMFRDSRALSCFGSNGAEEEEGFLRGGMGAVVGAGVGEREGAAVIVAERWRRRMSNGNDGGFIVEE
ncbi:PREDICTED: pentatricopeptide repeat-containing protein DOT4, chloroplastic-like [Camelina sativa]|uniref:Pentatricopeptide repeat-containing protein DOT4, chloroplastic-like n=1 Tax=Camelina sativa TaxID=90675 RepID=A0ABM1RH34_CAMSA|nr:PREDICTED: pentatricopeptide repeat-containing protein DOT4, chloroplastic-like [Camelina sativa]